ncbi:ecf transporter substrate-specific component [Lucifera butyrica]|uniref:Ecf transporter substrate-specific component n=1 Tax=Lucifera butyrica TaxID=1351585 RepID=A0A498R5P5_9FIRM|nr:folate family ECF transporter S component [Lucifera butyrica]VBB06721.1 ecf transporter substrate-specific component [Lucifera butyrica]
MNFLFPAGHWSKTRNVVLAAMFISLTIVLTHILAIQTPFIRIDLAFLPVAVYSLLFGPFAGAVVAAVADILGCLLFSPGLFFPGFTLSAFVSGIIYGLYFFKRKITLSNIIGASLTVFLLIDVVMNTLWLSILYHKAAQTFITGRIIKGLLMLPVHVILIYMVCQRLLNPARSRLFKNS